MSQSYSTVYGNALKEINSNAYNTKTNNGKTTPYWHFCSQTKFYSRSFFLINSNRFGLVHMKFLTDYLTLHTNFSHTMALQYIFIETIYSLIIQKNHFYTQNCVVSCTFQTKLNLTFGNQLNMQIVIPPFLIPMNLYQMESHHKNLLHHQLHISTLFQLLP